MVWVLHWPLFSFLTSRVLAHTVMDQLSLYHFFSYHKQCYWKLRWLLRLTGENLSVVLFSAGSECLMLIELAATVAFPFVPKSLSICLQILIRHCHTLSAQSLQMASSFRSHVLLLNRFILKFPGCAQNAVVWCRSFLICSVYGYLQSEDQNYAMARDLLHWSHTWKLFILLPLILILAAV